MTALIVALAICVGILAVLVAGLLRSHADILAALHELGITEEDLGKSTDGPQFETRPGVPQPRESEGDPTAHDIVGTTPTGGAARVAVVATRHTTLLAFLSSGCLTCRDFWEAFGGDLDLPGSDTRLVVVTQGSDAESPSAVASLAPPNITVLMSSEAWNDYAIPVSPYFLLVDGPTGAVIGEGAAATWDSVSSMLNQALSDTGKKASGKRTSSSRSKGARRQADTDEALAQAGIEPGDERLYHRTEDQ